MLYATAPRDTLAFRLKGRPLGSYLDRSDHSTPSAAHALKNLGWFNELEYPEKSASAFYLLNHAVADIATRYDVLEPLPEAELKIVGAYDLIGSTVAQRLFFYILMISAREFRHCKSAYSGDVYQEFKKLYPHINYTEAGEIFNTLRNFPDSASSALAKLSEVPKDMQLGPFVHMMVVGYYNCSWSNAYGGKKWGNIADCLMRYVTGEWSAEVFADTAFTLAHNTAPIFNKGMLYQHPGGKFIELLDCQRAGMVPQWLGAYGSKHIDKSILALVKNHAPHLFEGDVDWEKVMLLGSVGKYHDKITVAAPSKNGVKTIIVDHVTLVSVMDGRASG